MKLLEELIVNKSAEITDGVELRVGDEVNISIFAREGNMVVKFHSPSVHIFITKFGPLKLANRLRPTVEEIEITPESYIVRIDNGPDMSFERSGFE